jgi:hypothetical protein
MTVKVHDDDAPHPSVSSLPQKVRLKPETLFLCHFNGLVNLCLFVVIDFIFINNRSYLLVHINQNSNMVTRYIGARFVPSLVHSLHMVTASNLDTWCEVSKEIESVFPIANV